MKVVFIATTTVALCMSTAAFAGGSGGHHKPQPPRSQQYSPITQQTILSARTDVEARALAAAAGGVGLGGTASIGGSNSTTYAINAASAPSPSECIVVLPELFGAITIAADNRACQLGALSRGYINVGAQGKAELVLDALAEELKVKIK